MTELTAKVERLRPYIKNGGVTLSGGEPLMQPQFAAALFKKLKERSLHIALDTSGIGNLEEAQKVLQFTDLVICDVKFTTAEDYYKYCGGDFFSVLKDFLKMTNLMQK